MKALVAYGDKSLNVVDIPRGNISADEVLIAPIATGICGTDLDIIDGNIDSAYVKYPVVLGHEWCGRVVEVGSKVGPVQIGDRVVAEGINPCGICFECVAGNTNRCTVYDEIGFTRAGAAAELIVVRSDLIHHVANSVSTESAVLVEPCAVVTQGLLKAQLKKNSRILVIGDGTIAMIAAKLVHAWEPSVVHMLGLKDGQAPLAKQAGVDLFVSSNTHEKYDLIIEASGASSRITAAIGQLSRGGTLLLLGFTGRGVSTSIAVDDLVNGDLSILASFGYSRSAWALTVEFLNSGKLDLTFLVTHRFALESYEEAIVALRHAPSPRGKIVFEIGK